MTKNMELDLVVKSLNEVLEILQGYSREKFLTRKEVFALGLPYLRNDRDIQRAIDEGMLEPWGTKGKQWFPESDVYKTNRMYHEQQKRERDPAPGNQGDTEKLRDALPLGPGILQRVASGQGARDKRNRISGR